MSSNTGGRKPGGYALIIDPSMPSGQLETDTITCGHCNRIVHLAAGIDPEGGGCYQCGEPLCKQCVDFGVCRPFELWLDEQEGRKPRGRWAESFAEFRQRMLGGVG